MTPIDFRKELDLPEDADIHALESRFLEIVKERIQRISETYDEAAVASEEEWLRDFHKNFYMSVLQWVSAENKKKNRPSNHPDAIKLKKKAQTIIQALQKNIIDFSMVYMHLNRYVTLLRDEIRTEETRMGSAVNTNIKWTSDMGVAIRRYKKRKNEISADLERFNKIRPLLETLDTATNELQKSLTDIQGSDGAAQATRAVISSLRTGKYSRLQSIVKDIKDTKKKFGADQDTFNAQQTKALQLLSSLTVTVKENEKVLETPEGKLYLRPLEIEMVEKSHAQEMKKIRSYLLKYHLPYMQHKVNTLFHLKDKLMVVGSLDSLMALYKTLMIGLAEPITDIKGVRAYESEVLERITYLLETQFKEVDIINKRAEETVREFRQGAQDVLKIQQQENDNGFIDGGDDIEDIDSFSDAAMNAESAGSNSGTA